MLPSNNAVPFSIKKINKSCFTVDNFYPLNTKHLAYFIEHGDPDVLQTYLL